MADNFAATPGSGATFGMDEVVDGTLGTVKVGFGKIMDGTLDSTNKLIVNSSGEAKVTPTANSQVDVNKIAGTTTATGTGVMGAGVQRVAIASDNDAITVKQATGTNLHAVLDANSGVDIGKLTANQSVNVAQVAGTTADTNSGNKSAGTQRVVLATDQPALTTPMPVSQKASTSTSATLQSAVSATGNGSTLSVDGMSTVIFTVSGTFTATVTFEGTEDGTNYASLNTVQLGTNTIGSTATTAGLFEAPCAGLVNVRARVTWTSGTSVTVTAHTVPVSYNPKVVNANIVANSATNQSMNLTQVAGTTTATGTGVMGAGSQRVTIASDNDPLTVKQATAANLNATVVGTGTFAVQATPVTQADTFMLGGVNVKEINAVTPLMGNGATGTGSIRATVSNDNTGIANWGHGATGSAVPAGAQYKGVLAQTVLPTAGTAGNLTGALGDKFGRQVVLPFAFRDLLSSQTTTISASTSETTIVTAAASVFNDLFAITVSNTSATATRIDFRDTTAGSVIFQLYIPAGEVRGVSWTTPIPQTSVNTNWTATCGTSVTDVRITAWFVKNK